MTQENAQQDRPLAGVAIRLLSIIVLSSMFGLVKYVGENGVHVIEILFYRFLFGAVVTGGWMVSRYGLAGLKTNRPAAHIARALFGIAAMGMNFWAVLLLPMAEAATIGFTVPLIATIFSVIFLSEFVGLRRWAAVLVGFLGVIVAIQPWHNAIPLFGAGVALTGALMGAAATIMMRKLSTTESATTVVFYYTVMAVPITGLGMVWVANIHSAEIFAMLFGIGLLGTIGQIGLSESLRLANVSVVLPVDYFNLVFATAIGFVFFNQWPVPTIWLGVPLIVGSGLYIALRERKKGKKKLGYSTTPEK